MNLFFSSGFFNNVTIASVIEQYNLSSEENHLVILNYGQPFIKNKLIADTLYGFKDVHPIYNFTEEILAESKIEKIFIPHEYSLNVCLSKYSVFKNFDSNNISIIDEGVSIYNKSRFKKYALFPELSSEQTFKIDKEIFLQQLKKLEHIWPIPVLKENSAIFVMPHLYHISNIKEEFKNIILLPLFKELSKKYNLYIKFHSRDEGDANEFVNYNTLPNEPLLIDSYFLINKNNIKVIFGTQSTALVYINKMFNIPSYYLPKVKIKETPIYYQYNYITRNITHKIAKNIIRVLPFYIIMVKIKYGLVKLKTKFIRY